MKKVISLILALMFSVCLLPAGVITPVAFAVDNDVITFPDPNFEAAVREIIAKPSGDILKSDVENLTSLNVSSRGITSLEGIEFFLSLTSLICQYNQITELDVTGNTALTGLNCDYNQISELDVSGNAVLASLFCSENQLTELDVSRNNELMYFGCGGNKLTSLDVSNNPALTSLGCGRNQLGELDVSGCPEMMYLNCQINQITTLNISGCSALTEVLCDSNLITELDVSNCTALTFLQCGNNQITELDVTNSPALTNLSCSSNQLTELDVSNNTVLTNLGCYYNQLTELDVSSNTALVYLDCNGNELTNLDMSNNHALTTIRCSSNQIAELDVSQNAALTELFCEQNLLTELDVSQNTILTTLFCGQNLLAELDVSSNTTLTDLGCYGNQLIELDITENTALTYLGCASNKITELDINGNYALTNIECWSNPLTELDVTSNTALTSLHCGYNNLSELDVSSNTLLTVLGCNNNLLTELDVSQNTALEHLSCSDNQLTELDVSGNGALTYLSCGYNQITELDVSENTALRFLICGYSQLTELDVSNNTELVDLICSWNQLTDISSFEDLDNLNIVLVDFNFLDLEEAGVISSIAKIQETVDENNGIFMYEPQGRIISKDTLDEIKTGGVTVRIILQNGLVITIDPASITADARETDLNIDIEVTSTGNQVSGVPANSIVIRPFDHGEFGFEMSFVITAAQIAAAGLNGNNAKLFHIDDAGNVIEDGRIRRNSDGSITVAISRASYYVLAEETPSGGAEDPGGNGESTPLYNVGDIAVINTIIDNNGLDWPKADPADGSYVPDEWAKDPLFHPDYAAGAGVVWSSDATNKRIVELYLSDQGLTGSLDVNSLTELQYLRCSSSLEENSERNQLTGLIVSDLTNLLHLQCFNNQIEELDVSNLTKLTVISCGSNQIKEMDVKNLTSLYSLMCNLNQLTELDVSNLSSLVVLQCWYNQLTELDTRNLVDLEWLECGYNQIAELDVSGCSMLKRFSSGFNCLVDIASLEDLEYLQDVDVSYSFLELDDPDVQATIEKVQATVDSNYNSSWWGFIADRRGFYYTPQGRVIQKDILDTIKAGKVTVRIMLKNGTVIMIDPANITASARTTDINIDIEVTSTGNQVSGVPANSIVIRPFDHGEFGFEMSFVITAEQIAAAGLNGNNARLFHIDDTGNVIEDGRISRNADGSMTVAISRASYYVLAEETPSGGTTPSPSPEPSPSPSPSPEPPSDGGNTGGTGSGGGGGGSSTPATTAAPAASAAPTSVPGTVVSIPITVDTIKGEVTIQLDASKTESLIADANETAQAQGGDSKPTVTLDLSNVENAQSAVLDAAAAKAFAEADVGVVIKLPNAAITLDPETLATLATESGTAVLSVEAAVVPMKELTGMQAAQVKGYETVINIDVFAGEKKIDVPLTISMPYTLKPNEDPKAVCVWHLDDSGNLTAISGVYDAATGMITFSVSHQSYYVVGYDPVALWENIFKDVADDAWFYEAVAHANYYELFNGDGKGHFMPTDTMTRGMFVTVLWNLEGKPVPRGTKSFSDVDKAEWYSSAVHWAAENGIITETGSFEPLRAITRQEMAVILWNYANFKGYKIPKNRELPAFTDWKLVDASAESAAKELAEAGVMSGSNNQFMPQKDSSRAEVAALLKNFLRFVVGK